MKNFKLLREKNVSIDKVDENVNFFTDNVQEISLEYMRQNRFLFVFPENLGIPSFLVRSATRLSCSIINGVMVWNDLEIKFVNAINPSIQRFFYDMIRNNTITNVMEIKIQMLDPVGSIVNEWMVNGYISELNFGEVDYSSDSISAAELKMVVNHVFLNY